MSSFNQEVQTFISHVLQQPFQDFRVTAVHGGSINRCYRLQSSGTSYFLKTHPAGQHTGILAAETKGISQLQQQQVIRTSQVIGYTTTTELQILLMDWIDSSKPGIKCWQQLGEQLAALHTISRESFGWEEDNYIGALVQTNRASGNWVDFFIRRRLEPLVFSARDKHLLDNRSVLAFDQLYQKLPQFFMPEKPSLLHGDLWSGNFLCNAQQEPVLIDPAIYYGNRHMDLAMTTIFGGFDKIFFESYHHHFPMQPNYRECWDICNLYPLLVHLHLFGEAYLAPILTVLKKYG